MVALSLRLQAQQMLKKTALFDMHVQHGAKMVPFAGWSMPVQYGNLGIAASALHTRTAASLFDVSHMLQTRVTGRDRHAFLERLTVADVKALPLGNSTLSVFMNERGGVIDDTILNQQQDQVYVVSNAGCADKDWTYLQKWAKTFRDQGKQVDVSKIEDQSLLALQGPKAAPLLEKLTGGKSWQSFAFMTARQMKIKDIPVHVSRSGYTGEDGFEIQVPSNKAVELASLLVDQPEVEWAGLGARDVLRLEAGMCLYGHDLDEDTTPIEAGLTWTIAKRRRAEGGFLGADKVLKQLKEGPPRRRIGLVLESGAPAREGYEILDVNGAPIGKVTSGSPSPNLKKNIAMAYVKNGFHKSGTEVQIQVRQRTQKATVAKMPFVPSRYHKL